LVVGLCEEVRNRLLRFALEIREGLEEVGDKPAKLPQGRIEAAVVNHIYGKVVTVIGAAVNAQISQVAIPPGDIEALKDALRKGHVPESELPVLEEAIKEDAKTGAIGIGAQPHGCPILGE
jgi:hypothetical protein